MSCEGVEPAEVDKKVQHLTGKVAVLNRFVSRSVERCLPFFKTFKWPKNFKWIDECHATFEELKCYLGSEPLLSKLELNEKLYLYLAVFFTMISSMLVREEGKI